MDAAAASVLILQNRPLIAAAVPTTNARRSAKEPTRKRMSPTRATVNTNAEGNAATAGLLKLPYMYTDAAASAPEAVT